MRTNRIQLYSLAVLLAFAATATLASASDLSSSGEPVIAGNAKGTIKRTRTKSATGTCTQTTALDQQAIMIVRGGNGNGGHGPGDGTGNGGVGPQDGTGNGATTGDCTQAAIESAPIMLAGKGKGKGYGPGDGTGTGTAPKDGTGNGAKTGDCTAS